MIGKFNVCVCMPPVTDSSLAHILHFT